MELEQNKNEVGGKLRGSNQLARERASQLHA